MRAASAALILGIVGGVWLASRALSSDVSAPPVTVAAALALDVDGLDIDARRSEAVAVLVARCMRAHGLAWEARVDPAPTVPDPDLAPIAWAERWGFGVSTTPAVSPPALAPDPNVARLAALEPDVRARYRDTLYGSGDGDPGCQRAATDAVYGLRDRLLAPLRPALTDLDARIAADPTAVRAVDAWRSCVAPIARGEPRPDPHTLTGQLIGHFSEEARRLGAVPGTLAGRLALHADERRVATILARCDAAFAGARAAVAAPFEAAFVADHREQLTRIGAAIRNAEAALPTLPP